MRRIFLLVILVCTYFMALSQNPIGLPTIISFARSDYNGGLQNRQIVQDRNGIIYFANSEGLLSFDGTYWKLYPLPNKSIVRSIAMGNDGRIYAGGQNEMGYFASDGNGNLVFTSLKNLIQDRTASVKDVWEIVPFKGSYFFRSQNAIFEFDGKKVTGYKPASDWLYMAVCNGQLIAQDAQRGLFQFLNGQWASMALQSVLPRHLIINSLLPLEKGRILLTTLKNGLFILEDQKLVPFKFKSESPFSNQQILTAISIGKDQIAIGTHMGGLYIVDLQGNIIQKFSRGEGLQNNTILGLYVDKDRNLWMGLDDGIDLNAYNSAIKHIYPERLNEGAGYSSIVFNNSLYIGTSNWLYQLPVSQGGDLSTIKGVFKPVEHTKASAWGLFKIDDKLLLAHHEGAFQIEGDRANAINSHVGFWNFSPLDKGPASTTIIAGTYNGLERFTFTNGVFTDAGSVDFNESSRFVITEDHTAWVTDTYKGIFKIDLNLPAKVKTRLYTQKNGLPSSINNRLFRLRGRIITATEKGIYEYNVHTDRFEPSAFFKPIFDQKAIRYLKEDEKGNVWFIEDKKLGIVDFSGRPVIIYFPELNGKLVSDFENIYPLNEENIFVGAEKGFYHINYTEYKKKNSALLVLLRMVKASGNTDRILSNGYHSGSKEQIPALSYLQNSLHFEYSAPSFQKQPSIEYSYFLVNVDKGWSAWSKRTEKEYTNLWEGTYTFQLKARSNLGDESMITRYTFTVLPPWYRTLYAYMVYFILFISLNFLFYKWLKRMFEREKRNHAQEQKRLRYLHQLEMEKSEKEIIALKNQRLESEIFNKNSELASVAMHLLQKGDLLDKIREELVHLRKINDDMPSEELKKLIRILTLESKMDKEWNQFAEYFDNTHSDFLKAIKLIHPALSAHELKLCAYLRMNLTSKEMAQLMNITVRGVEISRYRLRKKLQVPTEINLHNYFTEISTLKKENADLR